MTPAIPDRKPTVIVVGDMMMSNISLAPSLADRRCPNCGALICRTREVEGGPHTEIKCRSCGRLLLIG